MRSVSCVPLYGFRLHGYFVYHHKGIMYQKSFISFLTNGVDSLGTRHGLHTKRPPVRRPEALDGRNASFEMNTGNDQWMKASWMAATARSASVLSMMTLILISLVEIIWMLIP